jgi:hypothetical protein
MSRAIPPGGAFAFEAPYRNQVWRFQITTKPKGGAVLSIWPWYHGDDGTLKPGAAKFGGGFQMPLERLPDLARALTVATAHYAPERP